VRVVVISVGRLRAPYADDVAHYTKLLGRYVRLEQIEIRERPSAAETAAAISARLPREAFVSLLAAEGESYDSHGFADFIEARRASGRDLAFVIGGAHGLELAQAGHRLSLGAMTMPHQLARVVLLEAVYRAHKLILKEPYHY
jgi:23S rRNA (pseudouridine1915-N3)-methyltransferase